MNNYYTPQQASGGFAIWTWLVPLTLLIIIAVGFVVYRKLRLKKAINLFLKHRKIPSVMQDLTPESFEIWVQGLFINVGAEAILSKREEKTGFDHGIDLIIKYKGQKICVQCKKYYFKHLVDETILRDLYGAKNYGKFHKAVIVTTSNFTNRAINWASGTNDLLLINGELLQKMRDDNTLLKSFLER